MVGEARDNAKVAGVANRVEFREGNLFEMDCGDVTVVTLPAAPAEGAAAPEVVAELKLGTRIVSPNFDMGDWAPHETADEGARNIYYW